MANQREWVNGQRQRSVKRTNSDGHEHFPGAVLYDEDARPVPLSLSVGLALDTLGEILAELRDIRRHLEMINDEELQDDDHG